MIKIVISGYYGFDNAGDEAMLRAIVESFRRHSDQARIIVLTANPSKTEQYNDVIGVDRMNFWQVRKAIAEADLVISGGGSLFQDVTSARSIYYYLSIIALAKLYRKKIMIYAQGIGPVQRKLARFLTSFLLNRVSLITVRDEKSAQELYKLKVRKDLIHVTADPVLAFPPQDKEKGRELLLKEGIPLGEDRPLIGVSVREWQQFGGYKKALAECCRELVRKINALIVFFPMHLPADVETSNQIQEMIGEGAYVLKNEYGAKEMIALIGCCTMLIGVRLHALIFAVLMGVPVIGLSYDPKVDRFLSSLNLNSVGHIGELNSKELLNAIEYTYNNREELKRELLAKVEELRKAAEKNVELAWQLVGSDGN
ncbi:MAG TPA: polysaccharide pyruvyl transferase CsaB [Clostridia bacterium]|nr:polysaccharide pyruvyl transferase CsaB [Clostridia bacterium]